MKVLITGGAGYIGATIASACLDEGITPIILDSLVTGRREFAIDRIFYEGDIDDGALINKVFSDHPDIRAAIHCAALISVPESVANPVIYYLHNVVKSLHFARHLIANNCDRLIFSSSAAVYEDNDSFEVNELSPLRPLSPYARTKVLCESMFEDIARSGQLRILSLRYFNPIGVDPKLRTGLTTSQSSHAVDKAIAAATTGVPFEIMGTDYPTRDGTGIRDYVHVWDIAQAHVAALARFDEMLSPITPFDIINLGAGRGTTVRELLVAFNAVSPTLLTSLDVPPRPGDTVGAYANNAYAKRVLGWTPGLALEDGIRDALRWSNTAQKTTPSTES